MTTPVSQTQAAPERSPALPRGRGLTWRSACLGFALASGLNVITPYNDFILNNTYIAGNHFPMGAVFVLLLLSLLNLAVRWLRGSSLLDRREIAVIYLIIMITSGIPSSGLLRYMIPCGTVPYYFASSGNHWDQLFWDYIPHWMAVSERASYTAFWEGLPRAGAIAWAPWVRMMSHWAVLFAAFWLMMLCLASLVRKQWADRERLAFPLVQFPLEVLRDDAGSFFRNRLVWIGAATVFAIHILNGLGRHFPALPHLPTFIDLDRYVPDRPWVALTPIYIGLFFSAIGFGYLLSLEVAAGFWGSVLFMKVQAVLLSLIGYEGGSAWGGTIARIGQREQMGGVLAMSAVLLWLLRGAIRDALRKAFTRAPDIDDSGEPLSYRFVVFGFLLSLLVAGGWLMAAGMTLPYTLAFLVVFICLCLILTRIIAEAGMLMIHFSFMPVDYLLMLGGSPALGPANLTALTFVDCALTFDLREFLMPSALNSFRLAELSGIPNRKLVPILVAALVVAVLVSVPAFLYTFAQPGTAVHISALEHHPLRFFTRLAGRLGNPEHWAGLDYVSLAVGAVMVTALSWLRLNFVWWPFHPLGFVMATSWASVNLWFSLFLGWLLKLLTIHYGGLRGYRRLRPLFLGLILGDVLGAVCWIIVGFFTKIGFMVTVN